MTKDIKPEVKIDVKPEVKEVKNDNVKATIELYKATKPEKYAKKKAALDELLAKK